MSKKLFLASMAMAVAVPTMVVSASPHSHVDEVVEFKDVTEESYAYEAIRYLTNEGIVAGYGNGYFGLKDDVTRGQVSALIVRYLQLDTSKDFENPYTDVEGNQFEDSILAVTDAGYMSGKGKDKFDPNETLTRAEMAVVLTNVFDLKVKADYEFHDMNEKHWANNAVKALYSNGITFGSGDYNYKPNQNVTREQYAEFLYRGINLDADFEAEPMPEKPTKGEKPAYTNSQGEMTRAGLARLIVETINPNANAADVSFKDIEKGSYTEEYILKAVGLGFIEPNDYRNNFGANQKVDRLEVSTWLVNGLANNPEYRKALKELQSDLTLLPVTEFLKGGIAKKDVPYVGVALGTGLLSGYGDHSFKPNGTITKSATDTIINRYKNIMKKDPKSFSDLNEFREIATTGTNILTLTKYEKFVDPSGYMPGGFENVLGKTHTVSGYGPMTLERVIVVDTSTKDYKGAFKDMFIEKGTNDRLYDVQNDGAYMVFKEMTYTPVKQMSYWDWWTHNGNRFYSGFGIDVPKKIKAFGYNTPLRDEMRNPEFTEPNTFFKVNKKTKFWGLDVIESKKTSHPLSGSISITTDDGNRAAYHLP